MTGNSNATIARTTPDQFAAELRANVDAWYALPNTPATFEQFGKRNRATWNRIQAAGTAIQEEVLRILREERI